MNNLRNKVQNLSSYYKSALQQNCAEVLGYDLIEASSFQKQRNHSDVLKRFLALEKILHDTG